MEEMERHTLLEDLRQTASTAPSKRCLEAAFRCLYGLPAGPQLELARETLLRGWHDLSARWPDLTSPADLLADPEGWIARVGRQTPEEPLESDPAWASFRFGLDGLLLAHAAKTDQLVLTSSSVLAVSEAINAMGIVIWMRDDPEAVQMWEAHSRALGRGLTNDPDAVEEVRREWLTVVNWLSDREVGSHPVEVNSQEIEAGLARWREHEFLLIVPPALRSSEGSS